MQTTDTNTQEEQASMEATKTFTVVMLYEDFGTGKRARLTYDFITDHLRQHCEFKNNMWKFDVLRLPKLRKMAAAESAMADMIIVSMHGESNVPQEVKAWLNLWLEEKGDHPAALVALVDCQPHQVNDPQSPCSYFREVARQGGLDFFLQ